MGTEANQIAVAPDLDRGRAPSVAFSNKGDQAAVALLQGEIELAEGQFEGGEKTLERASELASQRPSYLEPLARARAAAGDFEGATNTYLQVINKRELGGEFQEAWILAYKTFE